MAATRFGYIVALSGCIYQKHKRKLYTSSLYIVTGRGFRYLCYGLCACAKRLCVSNSTQIFQPSKSRLVSVNSNSLIQTDFPENLQSSRFKEVIN